MSQPASQGTGDVPERVYRDFLDQLAAASVPAEVISRLRKTLLEDRAFKESALREAIFGGDELP